MCILNVCLWLFHLVSRDSGQRGVFSLDMTNINKQETGGWGLYNIIIMSYSRSVGNYCERLQEFIFGPSELFKSTM